MNDTWSFPCRDRNVLAKEASELDSATQKSKFFLLKVSGKGVLVHQHDLRITFAGSGEFRKSSLNLITKVQFPLEFLVGCGHRIFSLARRALKLKDK